MDTYKIGTDIDKVNSIRVWLVKEIIDLDGRSVDYIDDINRINNMLIELIELLNSWKKLNWLNCTIITLKIDNGKTWNSRKNR